MRYSPLEVVTVVRAMPVSTFRATTMDPGTSADCGSRTDPTIVAVADDCARSEAAKNKRQAPPSSARSCRRLMCSAADFGLRLASAERTINQEKERIGGVAWLIRQSYPPQQVRKSWISMQTLEIWVALHKCDVSVSLLVRLLEPLKRFLLIARICVGHC